MRSDIILYIKNVANIMNLNKEKLIDMDQVVGDGDLGLTMTDGFEAAYKAIQDSDEMDIGKLIYLGGKAMANAVPSTMGTLMASGLMQAAKNLRGETEMTLENWIIFFESYEAGVMNRGKAKVGEKTFIDGIDPAVQCLKKHEEDDLYTLSIATLIAAKEGFQNTTSMIAVHGRAATRGKASIKLEDPGAYVAVLLFEAFKETMNK